MKLIPQMSPSMIDSFATCRLRWYWQYPQGYAPMARSLHFDLGKGVHAALAAYYKAAKDPVKAFRRWIAQEIRRTEDLARMAPDGLAEHVFDQDLDTLKDAEALGVAMLTGYLEEYKNEKLTILQVEKTVERPIPGTDWVMVTRIDTLIRDARRRDKVYVLEHKTFSRFFAGYLVRDHQFVCEKWAAETLVDEPIAGVLYNGLRKQIPSSRTKLAMFERHTVDISDQQVRIFLRRARDIHRTLTRGKLAIYPEPNPIVCGGCLFKEPCELYVMGDDYQFTLEHLYTRRSEPDEAEPSEAE